MWRCQSLLRDASFTSLPWRCVLPWSSRAYGACGKVTMATSGRHGCKRSCATGPHGSTAETLTLSWHDATLLLAVFLLGGIVVHR